eukprot:c26190_g1_i3 orf=144-566(+)
MVTCCYAMMQMEKAWRRSFPIQKDAAPRFGTMGSSSVARCSGLRPEYKEYGCCSKSSADTSSRAAKHVAPRDCTYGDCQGLWLADELQRLLSMQVYCIAFARRLKEIRLSNERVAQKLGTISGKKGVARAKLQVENKPDW